MNARTARMTMTTAAPASSGSGSLNGIAAQLSLPSMSTSRLIQRRAPCRAGPCLSGRARHRLVDDVLEQLRPDRAIGSGGHGLARLCQFGVAGIVEGRSGAAYLVEPGIEIRGPHRLDDEPHPGKAVAAEVC